MTQIIMLAPVGSGVGLTSISLGVVRAFEERGYPVSFFKPIAQCQEDTSEALVKWGSEVLTQPSFSLEEAEALLSTEQSDLLLEKILSRCEALQGPNRLLILEGLINTETLTFGIRINRQIASTLGARVVLVASAEGHDLPALAHRIEIAATSYGGLGNDKVIGCIVNKVGGQRGDDRISQMAIQPSAEELSKSCKEIHALPLFQRQDFSLVGAVPWSPELAAPRVKDLADYLQAEVLYPGEFEHRRVRSIALCTRTVSNLVSHLHANALLVTAGDRTDIMMAASLAVKNGTKVGGLLLTGGFEIHPNIELLCAPAFRAGLPVLRVEQDTWTTARMLQHYPHELPIDDGQRIDRVKEFVARHLDGHWLDHEAQELQETVLSPVAFRHMLTKKAREAKARIVLPEGQEPRTIKAASLCARRGIAQCILLGNPKEIAEIAQRRGIELNLPGLEIWEPEPWIESMVPALVELRKHKGMSEVMARDQLSDPVVLGTLLLQQGHVEGLVSGAVHTTADTIRPALRLIKTSAGNSLVSSVFFMLLPDRVLVYGDCAINPDPSAEQLAEIALQSADSAARFGLEPRVAMISYSTGKSGSGADVEKVIHATEIARSRNPKLLIDGPLQYDAAIMPDVAKSKAPNSQVAGKANVFIFPDLNTGNTTYKAVQRSANALSIGPMLQGLNKPVNDLSRGALVDDIVYTIALTAIQAGK
ncbi:phosphate acetyltransferase [bacterium (Candidatus Blackallbacteria) CG17_big_fil_post_rev_8_21_14_2_50_48_46]|uniref:Phosphate acetyltransferase n=1 Tax=bacterium (Candidatus Blackallbacteria) CG17_big_fil_post_rev_8_21_14_2_50_48_46 TaxID=2014261 RepID=A0A2M7FZL8_9BACT|nr:MAG: phosphate acetyltransferase [bacterium (Candidatus Blackallbacteria) CG18_big_fil_WC_8_21_14_2_50_49_26]PIW14855.1 MAG: phosphate acetyltransferase [bacterium (Candidatus Blackallbacteria) CG17_big_fil_post_rev_8_21_14_2_50_48_46]PIW44422.1 MAG: phosphate acetyltransferase [bacterium (Candidatus Blackallbacteria) CG13_big_fil_rev_8_21_14_2_50_49_14]